MIRALLAGMLLWGVTSHAQSEPLPERLYLSPGILMGSSRMIALGGAYVGVAEGASGISANLASIANRTGSENGPWQLSPVFTYMLNFGEYDFDNDGNPDDARTAAQGLGGLQFRYRYFGIGAFVRGNYLQFCLTQACPGQDKLEMFFWTPTLAAGYSFLDESLIVSVGLSTLFGTVENQLRLWNYAGLGVELGALVRPKGMPFRFGISARPTTVAGYTGGNDQLFAGGRHIYEGVVRPGVYSFGFAVKVGEGAFSFNDLPSIDAPPPSRALDARNPFMDIIRNRDDPKNGRLLIAAQVDIIQQVDRAVPITTFVRGTDPAGIGTKLSYTPRLGLEHATIVGRLKTRLGSYLEASPVPANDKRLHITGGTELFLFRLIDDWAATLTFDVAHQYTNIGVSIGSWR